MIAMSNSISMTSPSMIRDEYDRCQEPLGSSLTTPGRNSRDSQTSRIASSATFTFRRFRRAFQFYLDGDNFAYSCK